MKKALTKTLVLTITCMASTLISWAVFALTTMLIAWCFNVTITLRIITGMYLCFTLLRWLLKGESSHD